MSRCSLRSIIDKTMLAAVAAAPEGIIGYAGTALLAHIRKISIDMIQQKTFSAKTARLYNRIGAWHERLRKDKRIDRETLSWLFKFIPKNLRGKTALDAGCGSGTFSQMLLERGATSVVCLDISQKMLELTKNRKNDFKLKGMRIRRSDIAMAKFRGKSFDIVLAIYSLPYIVNLPSIFKNFYRMLKHGGILLIASDYYDVKSRNPIGKPISYLLGKIRLKGILHTKDNYTGAIKNAGFSVRSLRVFKKAYGLRIDPSYKYKNLVRQYRFGAILIKS